MYRHSSLITLFLLVSSLPAWSQADRTAGFGRITMDACDVEGLVGDDGLHGVQFLSGKYYVTGRAASSGNHQVYVLNSDGTADRQFDQSPTAAGSIEGWRDGMTDGTNLAFGLEMFMEFIDPNGNPVTEWQADNGQQTLRNNPMLVFGYGNAVYRALAYDPGGNGGNGSFFAGDGGSPIYEIGLNGSVLRSWASPTTPNDWYATGFALDPLKTTDETAYLWINGAPQDGDITLYKLPRDPVGNAGRIACRPIPRRFASSATGGLSGVPGGATDTSTGEPGSFFDLAGLDLGDSAAGTTDTLSCYRVHLYEHEDGTEEPVLLTRVNGGTWDASSPKDFSAGDTIEWKLDRSCGGLSHGQMWLNYSLAPYIDEAGPNGQSTSFSSFPNWELRVLWPGSNPSGRYVIYSLPENGSLPIPHGLFDTDDLIRIQPILVSQYTSIITSNQARFKAN